MASTGGTRKTRARAQHLGPERRRPQVLDAALELANEHGLGTVTIGSVATRMGVTRPVVYACYADRVEMINALLDREGGQLLTAVLEALRSSGKAASPEEAFVTGTRSLLRTASERADAWRLLLLGEPDAAMSERFRSARSMVRAESTKWIRPALEEWWETEDLDRKLPVLIELFMAICQTSIRTMLAPGNTWTSDDLGEFVGRALYRVFRDA